MDTRKKGRLSINHENMTKKGFDVVSLCSRHKGEYSQVACQAGTMGKYLKVEKEELNLGFNFNNKNQTTLLTVRFYCTHVP